MVVRESGECRETKKSSRGNFFFVVEVEKFSSRYSPHPILQAVIGWTLHKLMLLSA